MAGVKVSFASPLPEHHKKAASSDRHPSPDPVSDVSTLPEYHNKAACNMDHASTCSNDKTNQPTQIPSSADQCNSSNVCAHTAIPIAENQTAPLPPPPSKFYKQAAARPVKDFIHKVPPPLPANHPSKAAARKLHRRCSPCTQCMICVCCLLFAVIFLLALALLLFYLIAQPHLPKYDIESFTISELKLTNSTSKEAAAAEYVSTAMAMQISVQNPNKKMRVSHMEILEASVRYEGVLISEGSMEASMNQRPGNKTVLKVMAHADTVKMESNVAGSLKESLPSLPVQVDIQTHVALKLGVWTSRHVSVHVGCWVHVTFPATSDQLSKSCDLKVSVPFLLLFPSIII